MKTKHIIIIGVIFILSVFLSVISTLYIVGQTPFISTDSFIGTAVTLIALLVTIIIGYQIYNSVQLDSKLDKQNKLLKAFEDKKNEDMKSLEGNLKATYKEKLDSIDKRIAELDILKLQLEYNNALAQLTQLELKYESYKKKFKNDGYLQELSSIILFNMYHVNCKIEDIVMNAALIKPINEYRYFGLDNMTILLELHKIFNNLLNNNNFTLLLSIVQDLEEMNDTTDSDFQINDITHTLYRIVSDIKKFCNDKHKTVLVGRILKDLENLIEEEKLRQETKEEQEHKIQEEVVEEIPA